MAGPKNDILKLMDREQIWKKTNHVAEALMKETFSYYRIPVHKIHAGFSRRIRCGGFLHSPQYSPQKCNMDKISNIEQLMPYTDFVPDC